MLIEDTIGIICSGLIVLSALINDNVIDFFLVGLAYFTDLVEELDCAISGAKYGDYIMSGQHVFYTGNYIYWMISPNFVCSYCTSLLTPIIYKINVTEPPLMLKKEKNMFISGNV